MNWSLHQHGGRGRQKSIYSQKIQGQNSLTTSRHRLKNNIIKVLNFPSRTGQKTVSISLNTGVYSVELFSSCFAKDRVFRKVAQFLHRPTLKIIKPNCLTPFHRANLYPASKLASFNGSSRTCSIVYRMYMMPAEQNTEKTVFYGKTSRGRRSNMFVCVILITQTRRIILRLLQQIFRIQEYVFSIQTK